MGVLFMGGLSKLQRDHRINYRSKAGLVGAPMLGVIFGRELVGLLASPQ